MELKGVLFDLDGVITDTAKYHFKAWKLIADNLGIYIDESFNEELKGIDRVNSLKKILALGSKDLSDEEQSILLDEKNEYYLSLLGELSKDDILPGIASLLEELKENDIKVSIASISQNAPYILDKLELTEYIDAIADPKSVAHSKPAPDIFIEAARLINVPLDSCIGIEDAVAGIEAIHRAKVKSVGIGVKGDISLIDTSELNLDLLRSL